MDASWVKLPGKHPLQLGRCLGKEIFSRNGIRTLDHPTCSSHTELSLLLRAYLRTETEKTEQVATVKLF